MSGFAVEQNPASERSPSGLHWHRLNVFLEPRWKRMGSDHVVVRTFLTSNCRHVRLT